MSNFRNVLRFLRKNNNLTQSDLANALGLKFSTISMYERGDRQPDFEIAEAIADYFNVSMDFLHGRTLNPSRLDYINSQNNGNFLPLTVFNMEGVDGAHTINLNMDNFKEINDLISEVRDMPPEKIQAILQLIKTLK